MKLTEYKSLCRNCGGTVEYSHWWDWECLRIGNWSSYMPSDNLEYLEMLYDKSHSTI